jgi:hypothetical protein
MTAGTHEWNRKDKEAWLENVIVSITKKYASQKKISREAASDYQPGQGLPPYLLSRNWRLKYWQWRSFDNICIEKVPYYIGQWLVNYLVVS